MNAANDTSEPTTIVRGTTLESATWRVHRFANQIRATSLANAGRRGKVCEEFSTVVPVSGDEDEHLDSIAPSVAFAALSGASVDTMRSLFRDTELAGFSFCESSVRGIHVSKGSQIVVSVDLVEVRFTETEMIGRFTDIHGSPDGGTFRQDTIVGSYTRKDAAKAYGWASDPANRAWLATMTVSVFRSAMVAIGVRIS